MCQDGFYGCNLHVDNVQVHSRNSFWAPITFPALLMMVDAITNDRNNAALMGHTHRLGKQNLIR